MRASNATILIAALVSACASGPGLSPSTTAASTTTTTAPIETTTTSIATTTTTAGPTELTLVAPPDGLVTTEPDLLMWGLTSPMAEVTVNAQPAEVSGPGEQWYFEASVTLSIGMNPLTLIAMAPGSEPTEVTVNVRYIPEAALQFTFFDRVASTEVVADYAQFLTGQEANVAAAEDGYITTPQEGVPNDYYIRNVNPLLRTLELAPDVVVILTNAGIVEVAVPIDEWLGLFHEDGRPWDPSIESPPIEEPTYFGAGWGAGYWLTIDGEQVVQIRQQWVP